MEDTLHPDRNLGLDTAQNVRDLGGYRTRQGHQTRWNRFVRSGDMDQMSEADQRRLIDHGIHTVIDLRMQKEVANAPNVFSQSGLVEFIIHDFWGDRFDHYRSKRKDVSHEVKLADLYCSGLVESGFVMAEIMATIADSPTPGFAFHCRSGKDRTGLVAALLLALADVSDDIIAADYALTRSMLISPGADTQVDPRQPGYYLRGCEPETMTLTLSFLNEEYGGVDAYLREQGLSGPQLTRIREHLLA